MPKILLLNGPIYDFGAFDLWVRPLNLLKLARLLERSGLESVLFDCLDRFHPAAPPVSRKHRFDEYGCGHYHQEFIEKPPVLDFVPRRFKRYGIPRDIVEQQLLGLEPDVVVISCMMTYWYPGAVEMAELVRRLFPDAITILTGVYPILCPEHAAGNVPVDLIFASGDYIDLTNRIVAQAFKSREELRKECLRYKYLDPRYDLLTDKRALPIQTSSGCPYSCEYCASPRLKDAFHTYPYEQVLQNISETVEQFHTKDFAIYDDAFLIEKKHHAIPLLQGIVDSGLSIRFHTPNALHAREINSETANLMKQAGFVTIRLGLEFEDPEMQSLTGGKVSNEEFTDAVDNLKSAGFTPEETGVYVFLGYPGQSPAAAEKACWLVHESGCQIKPTMYAPTPGSHLWEVDNFKYRFDPKLDPLLNNSSLMPYRSDIFPLESYEKLKQKINLWNQEVREQ